MRLQVAAAVHMCRDVVQNLMKASGAECPHAHTADAARTSRHQYAVVSYRLRHGHRRRKLWSAASRHGSGVTGLKLSNPV